MLQIEVQHINKDTLLRSLTRDHISTLAELLAGDRSQETGDRSQEPGRCSGGRREETSAMFLTPVRIFIIKAGTAGR